ncbi:MAG TPA: hypothetical protein ENN49_02480 [Bacteroidales bacterium]|nr:hypothetical protein [Bacteroidales bacterium]
MKRFVILASITTIMLSYSCLNQCDVDCVNPPSPTWLKIVDKTSHQNLIAEGFYHKDSIKIYYFDGETKKYANIFFVGPAGQTDIIQTNIGILLPFEQLNTFYLYLNHSDIDTIQVRFVKNSDGCCTAYPLDSIAINGEYAEVDGVDYSFLIKK